MNKGHAALIKIARGLMNSPEAELGEREGATMGALCDALKLAHQKPKRKKGEPRYFLAKFNVIDGEHEHRDHVLIQAKTEAAASDFAAKLEHNPDCDMDCSICNTAEQADTHDLVPDYDHPFSYGDGMTGSSFRGVDEITKEQFKMLEKHPFSMLTYTV